MEYRERRFGEVPWKMETRDHSSRRYHGKWRQDILQLNVPQNMETRDSTAKRTTECGDWRFYN